MYPEQPDLIGTAPPIDSCSKLTVDQCMMQYPHHHRIVLKSDSNRPVIKVNIKLNLEQVGPLGANTQSTL